MTKEDTAMRAAGDSTTPSTAIVTPQRVQVTGNNVMKEANPKQLTAVPSDRKTLRTKEAEGSDATPKKNHKPSSVVEVEDEGEGNEEGSDGEDEVELVEPSTFCESLGQTTVVVMVGKEHKPFTVHKKRLGLVSAFFLKAFDGSFKEANESKMTMEEESVAVFTLFVEWLYNQSFVVPKEQPRKVELYVDVYLLADRIRCRGLKNYAMDRLQDYCYNEELRDLLTDDLTPEVVKKVFENTTDWKDSPIRLFCGAMASNWLFFGGDVTFIEGSFEVKGFLQDFGQYQALANMGNWKPYDGYKLSNDPRVRGTYLDYPGDGKKMVKQGLLICEFHVDQCMNRTCTSSKNFRSSKGPRHSFRALRTDSDSAH